MASFHFKILDAKQDGHDEVYQIDSSVDDQRFCLLFDKVILVKYVEGNTLIPNKEEQLADLQYKLRTTYIAALKTFLAKERLNHFN
jgi:hypothetical protein